MSNGTLDIMYRGMKLPSYDGKNIYAQMKTLNAAVTITEQVNEEYHFQSQSSTAQKVTGQIKG